MDKIDDRTSSELERLAGKYIWWKAPVEAVKAPERVLAQVMDIGVWQDMFLIRDLFGEEILRAVLRNAEAGWFRGRSWHYWHYVLGLAKDSSDIPPLPTRRFDAR
jgi:hypothetical protein